MTAAPAQNTTKQATWQQKVDHTIAVTLDPGSKTLTGNTSIHYFNNSPDTLRSIWLHVWANAYSNDQTAFARQQLALGKTDFHYSPEADRGFATGFHFSTGKDSLNWHFDSMNNDIIEVVLSAPLLPGTSVSINTPFIVKLPKIFSRGGVDGSFFAISQWYPKPAVYDINGWNTMPYLDQGEFYSEFGDYEVSITIPEKYTVAATGNLQTLSEIIRLNSLNDAIGNNHSNQPKTLVYTEQHVHDFAWFADTVFSVSHKFMNVSLTDSIKMWFFKGKGNGKTYYKGNPLRIIENSLKFYSKNVGPYPYKQCTVVIGTLQAGGGMEYPTITVCSMVNPGLIGHEIGHNWFYGMLGTNERKFPWMDESINTFYDYRAKKALLPDSNFYKKQYAENWLAQYEPLTMYLFSAKQGLSQPLNTSSEDFVSRLNYGSIVYGKGPLLFAYLEQQLGDSLFKQCVQHYFKTWQFKHPLPKDMQHCFEEICHTPLDWFFIDLLNENNTIDIKVNKRGFIVKESEKLNYFLHLKTNPQLNPYGFLPERNYLNNGQKIKPITLGIPFQYPRHDALLQLNILPIAGFNYYDKLYVGAFLFNRTFLRNKIELTALPAYGIGSKKLVGYGKINALFLANKSLTIHKTETGIQGQSFSMYTSGVLNQYYKIHPYVKINFKHKGIVDEHKTNELQLNLYRTGLTKSTYTLYDTAGQALYFNLPANYFSNYARLSYIYINKQALHSESFKWHAEYGSNYKYSPGVNTYIKTWINTAYKHYYEKKKYFKTELFAGIFLNKKGITGNRNFYLSGNSGGTDYLYNEAMLGRNEGFSDNGILSRQVIDNNGNMRNILPLSSTDKWMLALTNDLSLPGKIPFNIYADFGYYQSLVNTSSGLSYKAPELYTTMGISLPLFRNTLEIFVPIIQSQFDMYKNAGYKFSDYIGFKLHLNNWSPYEKIDKYRL